MLDSVWVLCFKKDNKLFSAAALYLISMSRDKIRKRYEDDHPRLRLAETTKA